MTTSKHSPKRSLNAAFFLALLPIVLTGAKWWSERAEISTGFAALNVATGATGAPGRAPDLTSPSGGDSGDSVTASDSNRRELLEALDRAVAYQHYYHSVYGHFTRILGRVGFHPAKTLAGLYDIHVVEAGPERLLITAQSEVNGRLSDLVSIDQNYRLTANFNLPPPRAEYLRVRAVRYLRQIAEASAGTIPEETGVYRGYFKFETVLDSDGSRSGFGVGVRPPVVGLRVELPSRRSVLGENLDPSQQLLTELTQELADAQVPSTGQSSGGDVMNTMEEAYLAQKIFRGEVGRYAKSWTELSQIAAFRFEDRDRLGSDAAPFANGTPESLEEVTPPARSPASVSGIVIEPIPDGTP